jgi:hypothetical protein
VQRHRRAADAARVEIRQHARVEVQAGRRRRNRPPRARIHRLIPRAIRLRIRATDVRRQRHVPERVDSRRDRRRPLRVEPHAPPPVKQALENLAADDDTRRARRILDHEPRARLQLLTGMDQSDPVLSLRRFLSFRRFRAFHQKTFDGPAARIAPPEQACGKHARVVDDQQVARIE